MHTISPSSDLNFPKNDLYVPLCPFISQFLHSALSRPTIFIISLLIPLMTHEYVLYVIFVASKIVLRHPKRDASKNALTPTISEYYEILRAN